MPMVALFSVIGAYAFSNSLWDVGFMLGFGVVAYFLEEQGYPAAPLVIGLILGPMVGGIYVAHSSILEEAQCLTSLGHWHSLS